MMEAKRDHEVSAFGSAIITITDGIHVLLKLGMEPQAIANRLGAIIDVAAENVRREKSKRT